MAKIVSTPFGFSLTHRDLEVSAKALLLSINISTSKPDEGILGRQWSEEFVLNLRT